MSRNYSLVVALSAVLVMSAGSVGCALGQGKPGGSPPTVNTAPSIIYVTDFYLDPSQIKSPPQAGGIRSRLVKPRGEDPESKAQTLVRTLSETIVTDLNKARVHAEYRPNRYELRSEVYPPGVTVPREGWLLGGWFVQVDEDNRSRQAAVGFGTGAGKAEVVVEVFDLAKNAREPFLLIGSESDVKIRPSGPMSKSPYVIPAKYVLYGSQTEDVKAVGSQIARNLIEYINSSANNR